VDLGDRIGGARSELRIARDQFDLHHPRPRPGNHGQSRQEAVDGPRIRLDAVELGIGREAELVDRPVRQTHRRHRFGLALDGRIVDRGRADPGHGVGLGEIIP